MLKIHINELIPQDIPLNITYEDNDLLIVNKEAGMVVHPGFGNYDGTLVNAVAFHFNNLPSIGKEQRPGLVHRLDKNTSGCLVLAKNKQSAKHFNNLIKNRLVQKTYVCVLKGNIRKSIVVNRPVYKTKNSKSKEAHSKFEKIKLHK